MMACTTPCHAQCGAANLLVALTLMMLITLGTLTVSHTSLLEVRMENNTFWSNRLLTIAESEWQIAAAAIPGVFNTLGWRPAGSGGLQTSQFPAAQLSSGANVRIDLQRNTGNPQLIQLLSAAQRNDSSGLASHVHQSIRLFSVLTPLGEKAPPLIANGCISNLATITDLRPVNSDTLKAGDALWQYRQSPCSGNASIDMHNGNIINRQTGGRLWDSIFSIDRQAFADLANADRKLPVSARRYWQATPQNLKSGRWTFSLGTARQPVVLYFPGSVGCPVFASGLQIFGMVFIEGNCRNPIATSSASIYGSLVVDGHLNIGQARLAVHHISLADPTLSRLRLPVLRYVPVPGSWRDF